MVKSGVTVLSHLVVVGSDYANLSIVLLADFGRTYSTV
jgi:hypothetical protein